MPPVESIEVLVGRIGKPHGIRGHVTIDVRTDEPERRFADGTVLRARTPRGETRTLTVEATRWHQGVLHARFAEIKDRDDAEGARGLMVYADLPADATPEDPDEYYDHQLVGLAAYNLDGDPLGEVTGLVHGAAQDLLVIRTPDRRDALVPFVKALVPTVDLAGKRVEIADRPGLVTPLPDDKPDDTPEDR